ncbi:MAG: glycosyltransferase family 39 protein [candidate division KSB1 bacterium]|nr:glycosyltransferase family 39 protein [candidate division KSB1 bacterium]MDZ7412365.1 glycosyltransferase family 39 protein [candidate division KSB1 bacterium]
MEGTGDNFLKAPQVVPWLLIVSGVLLLGISVVPFEAGKAIVDRWGGHGRADFYTDGLHDSLMWGARLLGAVVGLVGLVFRRQVASAAYALLRDGKELAQTLGMGVQQARGEWRFFWVLLAALIIGAGVRLSFLFEPVSYDEGSTFVLHLNQPLRFALARYRDPGNHQLMTVLMRLSLDVFGNHPWAIRLPALVVGLCLIPVYYLAVRRLEGAGVAAMASAVTASSGCLVYYSTHGRGYILGSALFVGQLWLAYHAKERANCAAWLLFAVVGALSLYTVPTMLYGVGVIGVYLVLCIATGRIAGARGQAVRSLVWSTCAMALFTLLLYAPALIVSGLREMTSNPVYRRLPLGAFAQQFVRTLPGIWGLWHRDVPLVLQVVLLAGFFVALMDPRKSGHERRLLVLAVPVFLMPMLSVHRVVPFPRTWVFMWPLYVMVSASGLYFVLQRSARRHAPAIGAVLASLLLAVNSFTVLRARTHHANEYAHFHDGPEVASYLAQHLSPGDKLVVPPPASMPVRYYFARMSFDDGPMFLPVDKARRLVVVVNHATSGPRESLDDVLRQKQIQKDRLSEPRLIRRFAYSSLYEMYPLREQ